MAQSEEQTTPSGNKDTSIPSLREKFRAKFSQLGQSSDQAYTDKTVSLGMVNELNAHEVVTLSNRHFISDSNPVQDEKDLPILDAAQVTSNEIVNNIADAERLKALDPNIKRVEAIVVASIMSPNDMQDVDPDIVVELTELSDNKKKKISELLTKFYCDQYELRKRMTNWVKEAHFRSGAGVTIVLPEATLTSLINTYDPDRKLLDLSENKTYGQENLTASQMDELTDLVTSDSFYRKVCDYSPYKVNSLVSNEERAGKEGIRINGTRKTSIQNDSWFDLKKFISLYIAEEGLPEEIRNDEKQVSTYKAGLEAIALNFAKTLGHKVDQTEQNYVKIVDNPEMLRLGRMVKGQKNQKFHSLYDKSVLGALLKRNNPEQGARLHYQDIPLMDLTGFMTDYDKQQSFPVILDVPTEAFIPICTPGDKTRILGGFILTDEYGQFIEASGNIVTSTNPPSNRISVAYNAMYGESPTESGIRTSSGVAVQSGMYQDVYSTNNKERIVKVFNYVLDEMLRKKLEDVGLADVTLGRYNAIAQCMLHRLLEKKKTRLVFVPEKYVTYVTFEQHFDGTGKSKIEDILYMESLKISFLTASTLAAMKNAVPVKKVKLNLDSKQRNTMQNVMLLRNAIIQREKLTPSTWPATVSSQLQTQNLSIETTHPNSEGFSFTVEDSHREIPKADTDFLEEINNATITGLGVMPSALSESSEVQFARSIATTNLYYAKSIRQDQIVLEGHATEHIRRHLCLSSILIYKIAEIIKDAPAMTSPTSDKTSGNKNDIAEYKPDTINSPTTVYKASQSIDEETFGKVLKVIDSVFVKLSPPDIAPDEAQYTILTETIKRIAEYVDAIYPDDLATFGGDDDVSGAYKLVKSQIKSQMVRDVANSLGFRGLMSDVPEMENFVLNNRDKLAQAFSILKGVQEDIKRTQQAMSKKQEQDAEGDSSATASASDSLW